MAEIILANLSDINGFASNTIAVGGTSYAATSQGIYLLSQSGAFTFTLPSGSQMSTSGFVIIKDLDGMAQTRPITVVGTIDGVVNRTLNQNGACLWLSWNGSSWSAFNYSADFGRILTAGNTTLVGGTQTVAYTNILSTDTLQLTRKTPGGTIGDLSYSISNLASFTINSDNVLDTSIVSYAVIRSS